MLPSFSSQITDELRALTSQGRLRISPALAGNSRVNVLVNDRRCTSFCSNDYLGLACDPRLKTAALEAANTSGFGASASRLVAGSHPEHLALETALASFVQLPAAILFPAGYQANVGLVTALAGPDDLIVADRHIHASLLDGIRLSKAKLAIYPHLDVWTAQRHLARLGPGRRRRFLVTESLFSMDGDVAPLSELAAIACDHDTILIIDEAHALGTLGPSGRGLCAAAGVQPDVLIATLGKAFGASGAFIAGSHDLRTLILNQARGFIFTTALPPPVAAAAHEALRIIDSPEGDTRRARLTSLVTRLHLSLSKREPTTATPIIPFILGSNQATLTASQDLLTKGIFVQAIRPPTVREGSARLRVTLSALHSANQVDALAQALAPFLQPSTASPSKQPPIETTHQQKLSPSALPPSCPQLPSIFLVGTDTGVGKTSVALALLHILANAGYRPTPFKPVESGASQTPTDAANLLAATERTDIPLDIVCPFAFPDPVAPAAHPTSASITLATLLRHADSAATYGNPMIVESAGGLLSPLSKGLTPLDLASALSIPVVLIARNALGTVNHTTLAVAEINRRRLPFLGTILVTTSPHNTPDKITNATLIAQATGQATLGTLPFLPTPTPARLAAALRAAVDITKLFPGLLI